MKKIVLLLLLTLVTACSKDGGGGGGGGSAPAPSAKPPRNMTYPNASMSLQHQIELSPVYPTYYGSAATSFSISPALPQGLHFSTKSGRIAGTPEQLSALNVYTITASNSIGSTNFQLSLEVKAQPPASLRYLTDDLLMIKGISNQLLIPTFNEGIRGGGKIVSFSITPNTLPAGLNFDTLTGYIEGTPSATSPRTTYTIFGVNSGGVDSTQITIEVQPEVKDLALGGRHSCVIVDNQVKCFGDNTYGQLGNGNNTSSSTPQLLSGLSTTIKQFTAGSEHNCLIDVNNDIYCWGRNQSGQLGPSIVGDKNIATSVGLKGANIDASLSGYNSGAPHHTCASILSETPGSQPAKCWGSYLFGNLSADNYLIKSSPSVTPNILGAIKAGGNFSCFAGNSGGTISCMGDNSKGQLADNQASGTSSQYLVNTGLSFAFFFDAGKDFACSIVSSDIQCWGNNNKSQLGKASFLSTESLTPIAVEGLPSSGLKLAIAAGGAHACSIINVDTSTLGSGGKVYCWGDNAHGQLGRGTSGAASAVPVTVKKEDDTELNNVTKIFLGEDHSCALSNNQVYCWGRNDSGQLGYTGSSSTKAKKITSLY